MAIALNKITHTWISTDSPETLNSDWVIDPVFEDRGRAMSIGPKYWTYSGSNVHALTDEEINVSPTFVQEAKDRRKEEVNAYRETQLYDYFTYDDKRWDCNKDGRNNISGLNLISVLNGGNLPPGITFRDYDNVNWPATAAYMGGMAGALLTFTNLVYVASWAHKAAIDALTTVEAVKSYDITTGWPSK